MGVMSSSTEVFLSSSMGSQPVGVCEAAKKTNSSPLICECGFSAILGREKTDKGVGLEK